MMPRSFVLAIALSVAGASASSAPAERSWAGFYDTATLVQWQAPFRAGLETNLYTVMLPRLTAVESASLAGLQLDVPLEDDGTHPMNFWARRDAGDRPRIVMPVAALRFLGDLCLAWAWLDANGHGTDTVTDYLALLARQGPGAAGTRRPLDALQIPADARADARVQQRLQGLFDSAVVFLLAHELGHQQRRHVETADLGQRLRQEEEADAFALEMMRRIGAAPVGAVIFFTATAHFEAAVRTHPTPPERLKSVAAQLRRARADYARGGTAPDVIDRVAARVDTLAAMLADPGAQELIRRKGDSMTLQALAPRARGAAAVLGGPPPAAGSFGGRWRGRWSDAAGGGFDVVLDLEENAGRFSGRYDFGAGPVLIDGLQADGKLHYRWRWGHEHFGRGVLQPAGGRSLVGTWGYDAAEAGAGRWTLERAP